MKRIALIAVALALTASLAQAGPGGPGGPRGPGGPGMPCAVGAVLPPPAGTVDALTNLLSLTSGQATALKTLLTASDATIQPLMRAAADASKALREAVFAATYDTDKVSVLAGAAADAEAAVVAAGIDT